MSSVSKGKGAVKTKEWAKHLRPFGKRQAAKSVRKDGIKQIKDETNDKYNKAEEDEQSISKQMKNKGSVTFKGPKVKERKVFAPPTKVETPKKGKGSYNRSEKFTESNNISKFVECLLSNNYADAKKHLTQVVETKLQNKIQQELNTPLFDK